MALHSHSKTIQLSASAIGQGIVQIQNIGDAGIEHFGGCPVQGIHVIAEDAIYIPVCVGGIQDHHRYLLGTLTDIAVFFLGGTDEIRTYKNQSIYLFGQNQIDVFYT